LKSSKGLDLDSLSVLAATSAKCLQLHLVLVLERLDIDISSRLQLEEALTDLERLQRILASMSDGVLAEEYV